MNLKEELGHMIEGDVVDSKESLTHYSHDASLFEVTPKIIVAPKNTSDIEKLVTFASEHSTEVNITPRSAGTDMTGGPLGESIILDLTPYFNKIHRVSSGTATTDPGVYYRDFEKATLAQNLLLPSFPASREICTVGGMVANNSGGEKSLMYGKTERYIQELKVVLHDGKEYTLKALTSAELEQKESQHDIEGELYRSTHKLIEENYELIKQAEPKVSKNSSGYALWNVWNKETGIFDLTKLFIGSQGTLGIITEITFNLVTPKPHSRLLVMFLHNKNLEALGTLIEKVLTHQPESFEFYDDHTLHLALRFLPEVAQFLKTKNIVQLSLQFLPEFWMLLTGGIPKLVLLAEFTGETEMEAYEQCKKAQQDLAQYRIKTHITKSEGENNKYKVIRRESFNLLRHHIHGKRTAPFIDDIIVPSNRLAEFLAKLEPILQKYKLIYTFVGHAGNGNLHIIPLMNLGDPHSKEIIQTLSKEVYDLVFQYQGSSTAEHNDGLIRSPLLAQMYGKEMYDIFRQVKMIFDPLAIFNPRKKIGASFEYAMGHLIKEK